MPLKGSVASCPPFDLFACPPPLVNRTPRPKSKLWFFSPFSVAQNSVPVFFKTLAVLFFCVEEISLEFPFSTRGSFY